MPPVIRQVPSTLLSPRPRAASLPATWMQLPPLAAPRPSRLRADAIGLLPDQEAGVEGVERAVEVEVKTVPEDESLPAGIRSIKRDIHMLSLAMVGGFLTSTAFFLSLVSLDVNNEAQARQWLAEAASKPPAEVQATLDMPRHFRLGMSDLLEKELKELARPSDDFYNPETEFGIFSVMMTPPTRVFLAPSGTGKTVALHLEAEKIRDQLAGILYAKAGADFLEYTGSESDVLSRLYKQLTGHKHKVIDAEHFTLLMPGEDMVGASSKSPRKQTLLVLDQTDKLPRSEAGMENFKKFLSNLSDAARRSRKFGVVVVCNNHVAGEAVASLNESNA